MGGRKSGKVGFAMGLFGPISRVGRQEDTHQVKATNDQVSLRTAVLSSRAEPRRSVYLITGMKTLGNGTGRAVKRPVWHRQL